MVDNRVNLVDTPSEECSSDPASIQSVALDGTVGQSNVKAHFQRYQKMIFNTCARVLKEFDAKKLKFIAKVKYIQVINDGEN